MNKSEKINYLNRVAKDSALLRQSTVERLGPDILETADIISGVIGSGGKVMLVGNGGLATAASHLAGELIVRLRAERNRQALPAVALCVDPAVMTAAANDYGYENVFSRQIEGLGRKGDMLMVLSVSGESANIVKAVQTARELGIITCAILGGNGGRVAGMVERSLVIPETSPLRVQEELIFLIHLLVEMIESDLFA
ncbi:MAG: SIS domain-containing protein [Candidatus Zixiibacteriota bacterium]|jgi:D-sedoheptulose 7-phosphate isomerase